MREAAGLAASAGVPAIMPCTQLQAADTLSLEQLPNQGPHCGGAPARRAYQHGMLRTGAKLQLRLQQTVEGLSVIVMTYYATGLIQYLAKGAKAIGLPTDPDLVALISVPLVAGSIFWLLSRRRKKHPLQL